MTVLKWLTNLMDAAAPPAGVVDGRSIEEVLPDRFSAASVPRPISSVWASEGWPFALGLAGWPARWPVWTCQAESLVMPVDGAR